MAKTVKITESEIRNAVMETFRKIMEDTKAQRKKKEDSLDESISKAINAVLNESSGNEHPITKWIYWTFNYQNPEEWMDIFEGAPTEHFMEKWNHCRGDMNRFFVELDSTNQNHLIDYVMDNYTGR